MYLDLVQQATLFEALHRIDLDLAERCRQKRCPYGGGRLDRSDYDRKPRGGPPGLADELCRRLSLCCGREGCRKRVLPPSCLFFGRKVYWGAVVLVIVAVRQRRVGSASAARLRELFDVSWETVKRWMSFFAEVFPRSAGWKRCRGLIVAGVGNDQLPAALIELFIRANRGDEHQGLIRCLEFLSTTGTAAGEHAP